MPKQVISFDNFLAAAGAEHEEFINQVHAYLEQNDCAVKFREAANGYVVSYVHKPSKRTVMNYVFRKNMPMLRVYADHTAAYPQLIARLPSAMIDTIKQGGNCSRLIDPAACNSRCLQGFDFLLDGECQQKCRCHMAFTFFLNNETKPYLLEIMENEMQARINVSL